MNNSNRFPILIPIAALVFAAAHIAFEYFTGGVKSHHLFARPDMPAISNWFGLITMPLLGVILGLRVRAHPSERRRAGLPVQLIAPFLGSLIYGALLAITFSLGAENVTTALFLGLFILGFVFPVYRIEYIIGFIAGMTFTFGGLIPLLVSLFVAAVSFVVRFIYGKIAGVFHKR